MDREIELTECCTEIIKPKPPFHFKGTFYKPSHFPTPIMTYEDDKFWQTMRYNGRILGIKLVDNGSAFDQTLSLSIYCNGGVNSSEILDIVNEVKWRFGLDEDITEFIEKFKEDALLGPVIKKWLGARVTCFYNLYELAIITILLQNATIRRTTQMLGRLLEQYGNFVNFDYHKMFVFWSPSDLAKASDNELRSYGVGYRVKYLKSISQSFVEGKINEKALRIMDILEIKAELLKLKGIGPVSAQTLLIEAFKLYNSLDIIPPWENKIYSMLLFGEQDYTASEVFTELQNRWGQWRGLAIHYLFEDLFWRRKSETITWLEKLIRL